MKRTRLLVGTILIVTAIVGMIFWETKGRETLLMEDVLVADQRMEVDTDMEHAKVRIAGVLKENVVEGALGPEDRSLLKKGRTSRELAKNQQITKEDLIPKNSELKKDLHIFPLKPQWIDTRSSSLRKDDWVAIYLSTSGTYVGTYRLAFVKDETEQEVLNDERTRNDAAPLSRTNSIGQISHVEIIATLADYRKLRDSLGEQSEEELLQERLILVGTSQRKDEK